MIPKDYITEWRACAPWIEDRLNPNFTADMTPLLAHGQSWKFDTAYDRVCKELIELLPGDPWKGSS